jgi:hypothetical protein
MILCNWFGHVPRYGYGDDSGSGYFEMKPGAIDGIGRLHAELWTTCKRCGQRYRVGKVHIFEPPRREDVKPGEAVICWLRLAPRSGLARLPESLR